MMDLFRRQRWLCDQEVADKFVCHKGGGGGDGLGGGSAENAYDAMASVSIPEVTVWAPPSTTSDAGGPGDIGGLDFGGYDASGGWGDGNGIGNAPGLGFESGAGGLDGFHGFEPANAVIGHDFQALGMPSLSAADWSNVTGPIGFGPSFATNPDVWTAPSVNARSSFADRFGTLDRNVPLSVRDRFADLPDTRAPRGPETRSDWQFAHNPFAPNQQIARSTVPTPQDDPRGRTGVPSVDPQGPDPNAPDPNAPDPNAPPGTPSTGRSSPPPFSASPVGTPESSWYGWAESPTEPGVFASGPTNFSTMLSRGFRDRGYSPEFIASHYSDRGMSPDQVYSQMSDRGLTPNPVAQGGGGRPGPFHDFSQSPLEWGSGQQPFNGVQNIPPSHDPRFADEQQFDGVQPISPNMFPDPAIAARAGLAGITPGSYTPQLSPREAVMLAARRWQS